MNNLEWMTAIAKSCTIICNSDKIIAIISKVQIFWTAWRFWHLVDDGEDVDGPLGELLLRDGEVDEELHQPAPDQGNDDDETHLRVKLWQIMPKSCTILQNSTFIYVSYGLAF